jgi:hypothetical protein
VRGEVVRGWAGAGASSVTVTSGAMGSRMNDCVDANPSAVTVSSTGVSGMSPDELTRCVGTTHRAAPRSSVGGPVCDSPLTSFSWMRAPEIGSPAAVRASTRTGESRRSVAPPARSSRTLAKSRPTRSLLAGIRERAATRPQWSSVTPSTWLS